MLSSFVNIKAKDTEISSVLSLKDEQQQLLLDENKENLEGELIRENISQEDNYFFVESTSLIHENEFIDQYVTNVTLAAYDPIGGTYVGTLYKAKFIVYVTNAYSGNVTFRKPVYYTQTITSFDSGLGNPASLTSTAHFTGVWGPVGDPQTYLRKNISSLRTSGTSLGTRYTNISEYFVVSLTNSCFFDISAIWNVKGGTQTTLTSEFTLW